MLGGRFAQAHDDGVGAGGTLATRRRRWSGRDVGDAAAAFQRPLTGNVN